MSGGPFHGQVMMVGGCDGLSQARLHAPVGSVGSAAVGLKQGTHFSPAPHTSLGRSDACDATAGKHTDVQRPSAPATEVQVLGTKLPPVLIRSSGAQKPEPPPEAVQGESSDCCAAGTTDAGRQW